MGLQTRGCRCFINSPSWAIWSWTRSLASENTRAINSLSASLNLNVFLIGRKNNLKPTSTKERLTRLAAKKASWRSCLSSSSHFPRQMNSAVKRRSDKGIWLETTLNGFFQAFQWTCRGCGTGKQSSRCGPSFDKGFLLRLDSWVHRQC